MREIEWKPMAAGIGVALTLFLIIYGLLRVCCYQGEGSAYGI